MKWFPAPPPSSRGFYPFGAKSLKTRTWFYPSKYRWLSMARRMHEAAGLPSLGWGRVLQDGGLEFGALFCLMIVNGTWNWIMRKGGGGRSQAGPCLAAAAAWLSSQLNAPFPSPGVSAVRWHIAGLLLAQPSLLTQFLSGIMRPRKGWRVNQASVYSSVFVQVFFFPVHCLFPSPTHRRSSPAIKPGGNGWPKRTWAS